MKSEMAVNTFSDRQRKDPVGFQAGQHFNQQATSPIAARTWISTMSLRFAAAALPTLEFEECRKFANAIDRIRCTCSNPVNLMRAIAASG
jgi:hypothetical protein